LKFLGAHAQGDCISIDGGVSRYIEPMGHPARPYLQTEVALRIKTTSLPITVQPGLSHKNY
jgi:hypothetical protein